ncbi:MAG: hypothetical protein HYV07_14935 [Deltaproteobacteria bacterium]|nr:hypothetical protein [Deltaproteobacteria bacterium]
MSSRIVQRPRSLDEVIDLSCAYVRAYGAEVGAGCSFLALAGTLVALTMARTFELDWGRRWALVILESVLVGRVALACFVQHVFGRPFHLVSGLLAVAQRPATLVAPSTWPWLLALTVSPGGIWGLVTSLSLIVAAPLVLARSALTNAVVFAERTTTTAAVRRSHTLTRERVARTTLSIGAGAIILALGGVVGDQIFVIALEATELHVEADSLSADRGSWGAVFGLLLASCFSAAMRALEYADAIAAEERRV